MKTTIGGWIARALNREYKTDTFKAAMSINQTNWILTNDFRNYLYVGHSDTGLAIFDRDM